MSFALIAFAALLVSTLTLFSGFGLGSLLMPVFALFMPVESAVAATALVHGANSLLKTILLGRHADRELVLRFGLPAMLAALAGAALLGWAAHGTPLLDYEIAGIEARVTHLKLLMAALIAGFALFELLPRLQQVSFPRRFLIPGGLASGFFGGLSGHQGALRSAFLLKAGVDPQTFVGTTAVISLMVDAGRIAVYALGGLLLLGDGTEQGLVLTGVAAAFAGVVLGKRLLKKMHIRALRMLSGGLLFLLALALAAGLV